MYYALRIDGVDTTYRLLFRYGPTPTPGKRLTIGDLAFEVTSVGVYNVRGLITARSVP